MSHPLNITCHTCKSGLLYLTPFFPYFNACLLRLFAIVSSVSPSENRPFVSPRSDRASLSGLRNREAVMMGTLFPKIGKLSDFIYKFKRLAPEKRVIPVVGRVKLHGAHADWVVSSDNTVRVQSRNLLELSSSNDIYGLYDFSAPLHTIITSLRDGILVRFKELNPEETIDTESPVIISGEWCGQSIQKGVAISKLPKHFVIISIRINGTWVDEGEYGDICNEANGVYNIGKYPDYRLHLDLDNIECSERAIQALVNGIDQECPYGLARGVHGRGEGIVWKATGYQQDPELWFKSKAESYAVSNSSKLPANAVARDNRDRENNFAAAVVTEGRLEQGWEYLTEMGVKKEKRATGKFVAWITNDVLAEEGQEMAEKEIDKGKLKVSIKFVAEAWYKKRLFEDEGGNDSEIKAITGKVGSMTT